MPKHLAHPTAPAPLNHDTDEQLCVLTRRAYETLAEAQSLRPIGNFLLRIGVQQYALCCGNVLNDTWDWQYVGNHGKDAPPQLFTTEVWPRSSLPLAPKHPPPLRDSPTR